MEENSKSAMPKIAAIVVAAVLVIVGIFLFSTQGGSESDSAAEASATSSASVAGLEGLKAVPEDATPCPSTFGSPDVTTSAVASTATSCELAEEVRRSYLQQPLRYGLVTVDARNPATRQVQSMNCSGSPVVTCVGGDGDVIYLN